MWPYNLDFSQTKDCTIHIDRVISRLPDSPNQVHEALRSAKAAAEHGDFHAMQIHLETAQTELRPVTDTQLDRIVKFRCDAPTPAPADEAVKAPFMGWTPLNRCGFCAKWYFKMPPLVGADVELFDKQGKQTGSVWLKVCPACVKKLAARADTVTLDPAPGIIPPMTVAGPGHRGEDE